MEGPEVGMTSDSWWIYCSRRGVRVERKPTTPVDKGVQGAWTFITMCGFHGLGPAGGRPDGIISWQKLK